LDFLKDYRFIKGGELITYRGKMARHDRGEKRLPKTKKERKMRKAIHNELQIVRGNSFCGKERERLGCF